MLSVCLIVKNEEKTLPRCLDSLAELKCEVCIVDTGSSDATLSIAKRRADKCIQDTTCNDDEGRIIDFSKARNIAIDMASGPWILTIDADEILSPGSAKEIKKYLASDEYSSVAIEVSSFDTSWPAFRLFKKLPQHYYEGIVHERIIEPYKPTMNRKIRIVNLPDKKNKESSVERDLRLCSLGIQLDPDEIRYKLYLARALKKDQKYDESLKLFIECAHSNVLIPASMHAVYTDIAVCYLLKSEWKKAKKAAQTALTFSTSVASTYCVLGDALLALGKVKEALATYKIPLQLNYPPLDYPLFVEESFYKDYPLEQINFCNELLNKEKNHFYDS